MENVTLTVHNAVGQLVHSATFTDQPVEWEVGDNIEAGIYYYSLTNDATTMSGKIIVTE